MDDTLDTLDTSVDIRALEDAGDFEDDVDVTEQIPALGEDLDITALNSITGGMRWEQFRPSTNVEDRRSPRAIARDQQWWDRNVAAPVPLPPRRPQGL